MFSWPWWVPLWWLFWILCEVNYITPLKSVSGSLSVRRIRVCSIFSCFFIPETQGTLGLKHNGLFHTSVLWNMLIHLPTMFFLFFLIHLVSSYSSFKTQARSHYLLNFTDPSIWMNHFISCPTKILYTRTSWRNGSASDSKILYTVSVFALWLHVAIIYVLVFHPHSKYSINDYWIF